jgi:undecaprenyl-phosphate 4-deoxy-4-formamido-L-arabinose transferase
MAGLREARGNICVVMDADLQNPPEEVPKLVAGLDDEYDFVFGVSPRMHQGRLRAAASRMTFWMANLMFEKPRTVYPSSFFAIRRSVVREITAYDGPYPYISGLIFRATNRGRNVNVEYHARKAGKSCYNLAGLLRLWFRGFTNFSVLPLRVASFSGMIISLLGFVVLAVILIRRVFLEELMMGWASIIGATLLFSGIQLLALGMVGEYVGRIFMLLNKTPQYAIRERINCGP